MLALLAATDATVTGESAATDQARGDPLPADPLARPSTIAGRNERSATQGGRRTGT